MMRHTALAIPKMYKIKYNVSNNGKPSAEAIRTVYVQRTVVVQRTVIVADLATVDNNMSLDTMIQNSNTAESLDTMTKFKSLMRAVKRAQPIESQKLMMTKSSIPNALDRFSNAFVKDNIRVLTDIRTDNDDDPTAKELDDNAEDLSSVSTYLPLLEGDKGYITDNSQGNSNKQYFKFTNSSSGYSVFKKNSAKPRLGQSGYIQTAAMVESDTTGPSELSQEFLHH